MDIQSLLEQVKAGSNDAFITLAQNYEPLVQKMTAKYQAAGGQRISDTEDFSQELYLVLYNAAMAYDLHQENVSFGLYAKICMNNKLVSVLRRRGVDRFDIFSIDDLEPWDDTDGAQPLERLIEKEDADHLRQMIHHELSDFETAVYGLYILDQSSEEIALAMGVSPKSVNNAIYRIRVKIKKLLQT